MPAQCSAASEFGGGRSSGVLGGRAGLKETEEIVAVRELWEIKSPRFFMGLRGPWERCAGPGAGPGEITEFQAVGLVCGKAGGLCTVPSSLQERGLER